MKNLKIKIRSAAYYLSILSLLVMPSCNLLENQKINQNLEEQNVLEQPNYELVATGQVATYGEDGEILENLKPTDALYGQDAHYLKGKKMSFQKNNNGSTKDLNTGLSWQTIPTTEGFDWQSAADYCQNLELDGHTDWRMPTLKELFSISDFNTGWPYIDTNYFSLVNNKNVDKSEQYWADNKYIGHTEEGAYDAAFGVNHATGHIKAYPGKKPDGKKKGNGPPTENRPPPPPGANGQKPTGNPMLKHVRAVRGTAYGINNFVNNQDGTISDKATGLMWSTNDSQKGLDWKNALVYAENKTLAGYSDWRLPNVKELQSIVDYSFAPNAKDKKFIGPAIDPLFNCTEITNENNDKDYPYYWTSTSARFQKGKPYYYAWYVAFGRAVNNEGLDFHGAGAVRFDTKHENGPASEGGERYYNYIRLVRNI